MPMQQAPSQYQPAPVMPGYPQQPVNYGYNQPQAPVQYNVPQYGVSGYNDYIPVPGPGETPPVYRPPGAKRENKNGIPTRKDGRVDTTYRQRMAARAKARGAAKPPATLGTVPPTPPRYSPNSPTSSNLNPTLAPTQMSLGHQSDVSKEVTSEDVKVDDLELSTLAMIAIGTGVISVICGITLMLFLYQKRQKSESGDSYKKYIRDHTPVSRHTSESHEQEKRQSVSRPRDFMDQKDVEMVRTLSRAPMAVPDEYYLKSSESKDSGFNSVSRKASYVTSLKS
jgi:hypothetical protein